MNRDAAETLCLEIVAFLAADERRLGGLLAQSGWSLEALRDSLTDPAVLAGILDYLLGNEHLLVEFCTESGHAAELPGRARRALAGREA